MKTLKRWLLYITMLGAVILLIISGERSVSCAREAVRICLDVIVPSLFPFFICSGVLIYSGFCDTVSAVFRPVMKPLFNVGGAGAGAFVIGILSGYPLGAHTACKLYESNYLSKTEAERLLAFCNNSGPLFILGSVGISLYSSPQLGAILYASHILACVTVGILFRFYKRHEYNAYEASIKTSQTNMSGIFSTAAANSIKSMLTICATVIFFSTITVLAVDLLPINSEAEAIITGLCEFVTGSVKISQLHMDLWKRMVMSAFIIGFAGLSVHMQVMSVTAEYDLSLKPYILGKVMHGIISAVYMWLALKLFQPARTVFADSTLDINGGFAVSSAIVTVLVISAVLAGAAGTLLSLAGRRK